MTQDENDYLDDMLTRWYAWSVTKAPESLGFPKESASCKQFRSSRQHDDSNGALDTDLYSRLIETIDEVIDNMDQPWRAAIEFNARNLSVGAAVWRPARIAAEDLHAVTDEARRILWDDACMTV